MKSVKNKISYNYSLSDKKVGWEVEEKIYTKLQILIWNKVWHRIGIENLDIITKSQPWEQNFENK